MKVGILGSGDVAKALAGGFLRHGHQVMLGTRDAAKLKDFAAQHRRAQVGSFVDTAKFGELVVLAVKGTVALDALRAAGAPNIAGKPVMDATNPALTKCASGNALCSRSISERFMSVKNLNTPLAGQFRRQCPHDQPAIPGGQADDVHLWQR